MAEKLDGLVDILIASFLPCLVLAAWLMEIPMAKKKEGSARQSLLQGFDELAEPAVETGTASDAPQAFSIKKFHAGAIPVDFKFTPPRVSRLHHTN